MRMKSIYEMNDSERRYVLIQLGCKFKNKSTKILDGPLDLSNKEIKIWLYHMGIADIKARV